MVCCRLLSFVGPFLIVVIESSCYSLSMLMFGACLLVLPLFGDVCRCILSLSFLWFDCCFVAVGCLLSLLLIVFV